jgi:peptidoglycan hydrolase-like protein with peptidoglycan-binding domain
MTIEDVSFQLATFKKEASTYPMVLGASTDGTGEYAKPALPEKAPKILLKGLKFASNGSSMIVDKNVKFGTKDCERVKKLQIFLSATGDLNTEPTCYFGPKTKEALKKFQFKKGIKSDGSFFGPITRQAVSDYVEAETKE